MIIIGVLFYVIISNTPLYEDDYYYTFFNSPDEVRDSGLGWNFIPGYVDNFSGVARFIPHLFVALFSLVLGKGAFNVVAACGFVLLCLLIGRVASDNWRRVLLLALCSSAIMWFIIPGFFKACMWMSGACNYLFVSLLVLAFYLALFSRNFGRMSAWYMPLWFLFGFIVGWTNEGYVIGLAVGLFIYYMSHHKELDCRRISMLAGFYLGAVSLCLSPLNLYRFFLSNSNGGAVSVVKSTVQSILALDNLYVTYILFGLILAIYVVSPGCRYELKRFVKDYIALFIALIVSGVFVIMTHHTSDNSRFPMDFYALVLLISLLNRISGNRLYICSWVCFLALFAGMVYVMPYSVRNYKSYKDMESQMLADRSVIVAENVDVNPYVRRYVYPIFSIYESWGWKNGEAVKSYYGSNLDSVILSTEIYDLMRRHNDVGTRIYKPSWGMSWIRVPNVGNIERVVYKLEPSEISPLQFWKRAFGRYTLSEVDAHSVHVIRFNGDRWIVVLDNPMIKDREDGISVYMNR